MKILLITQYFPPETGAVQNRLSDLAENLASSGHSVTVLTAMPNYPTGKIFKEYRGQWLVEEHFGRVKVIRTWVVTTTSRAFVPRLTNYLSFAFGSVLAALFKIGSQDIVFTESPPLFLGLSGLFVSWLWGAKFVFNVSDLWPQSAVDLGILQNRYLIRLSSVIEEFTYRHADLVTVQTQGILANIRCRVQTEVLLYTNGFDSSTPRGEFERKEITRRLGFSSNTFIVGYAGLHGLAQALESVLFAAEKLIDQTDIAFLFFGDGPAKTSLQQCARERSLTNVHFFAPEPSARMREIISSWDASLVPLKKLELFKGALPSKLFESMGIGVPVILAASGEAQALVENAGAGICVPPEDPAAMVRAILFLKDHPDLCVEMGRNARHFIAAHYDRRAIAARVEQALIGLVPRVVGTSVVSSVGKES